MSADHVTAARGSASVRCVIVSLDYFNNSRGYEGFLLLVVKMLRSEGLLAASSHASGLLRSVAPGRFEIQTLRFSNAHYCVTAYSFSPHA